MTNTGKEAITHDHALEEIVMLRRATRFVSCWLETGSHVHQIRHPSPMSGFGHPVCGESVYNRKLHADALRDASEAPRLMLHAVELGFVHPVTEEAMHWEMPPPDDFRDFVTRLRGTP